MIFMLFDPKINIQPSILWWIGGIALTFVGGVVATTVKVLTRNHMKREDAFKHFQSKTFCEERSGNIEEKIDNLKDHITQRFDDLKDFINKNGGIR